MTWRTRSQGNVIFNLTKKRKNRIWRQIPYLCAVTYIQLFISRLKVYGRSALSFLRKFRAFPGNIVKDVFFVLRSECSIFLNRKGYKMLNEVGTSGVRSVS